MAKKFNMVAAKEFLIKHGEKVVLGVCAFIAISFGILGLMRAANAGRAEIDLARPGAHVVQKLLE